MNTNIKITLNDAQRNVIKRRITGKNTKAMVSRAELNALVQEYINDLLAYKPITKPLLEPEVVELPQTEAQLFARSQHDLGSSPSEKWHDECCRANDLLRTRINKLQHRLDTK